MTDPNAPAALVDVLPCDVFLAPCSVFRKGVSLETLCVGLRVEGRPGADEYRLVKKEDYDERAAIIATLKARDTGWRLERDELTAEVARLEAELAKARDIIAAMILTHDAGGVTLSAMFDARQFLTTEARDGTD
jgi:hypothetical protein